MLFYLAAHRNPLSRDEIISVLWDQQPVSKSRLRLNESLSRLKSSLPFPDLVISEGDALGLDYEQVTVDLHAFEDWITQAGATPWQIPRNEPLPKHTAQNLQSAIELWRGDEFMAGSAMPSTTAFDEWLTLKGSRLGQLRGSILERLTEHACIIRDLERSIQNAQQALEYDEYNTNLHFRVMACLIDQGRFNQAGEYYEHVRNMLQDDLNSRPPTNMVSLYESIPKHQDAQDSTPLNGWVQHPNMKVPFIGRKDILVKMRQSLNQHKCLCILGEAGQGKTRLVQEYLMRLHPQPQIMVVSCQPLETALPFQPLRDAFREHIQPEEWGSFNPIWAGHLMPLLPELATNQTHLNPPSNSNDPIQGQTTIMEAIRQVFIWYFKDQISFLIFDNAHWADEATLATISYLHSRPPFDQNGHLVVLSHQEEQSPFFERILNSVGNTQLGETLYLPHLDPNDVADLTRFVLKNSPSQAFIENIMRDTGGNTLFVLETLQNILEKNPETDLSGDLEIPLPESITYLIQSRVRQLKPAIKTILENAAVLGSEFDLNTLAGLTNQSVTGIAEAIEELEKRLILHTLSNAAGAPRYRFNHEIFHQILLKNMSPAKKMVIHGNVAAVLAENEQPQQATVLAYHYQAAGKLTEAYQNWVAAGDRTRELYSISDAHRFYSQAEALLQEIEETLQDDDIYRLYMPWYEMTYITHNAPQVRKLGNNLKKTGAEKKKQPADWDCIRHIECCLHD